MSTEKSTNNTATTTETSSAGRNIIITSSAKGDDAASMPVQTEMNDSSRATLLPPPSQSSFYQRLQDPIAVDSEMEVIQQIRAELNALWEVECAKYEQSMVFTVEAGKEPVTVPMRNYFNPAGRVRDTSLFPYHDAFYPLIDAYDCLYDDFDRNDEDDVDQGDEQEQQPLEPHSIRPLYSVPVSERRSLGQDFWAVLRDEHDFTPVLASPQAVCACVFPQLDNESAALADIPVDLDWTMDLAALSSVNVTSNAILADRMVSMYVKGQSRIEVEPNYQTVPAFPLTGRARALLLLRLFRHALSELQRDYYLAGMIVNRLAHHGDLDDPDVLRRLLITWDEESVPCGYPCPAGWGEEHVCSEWGVLVGILITAISNSISLISDSVAIVLAGQVKSAYHKEFGHLMNMNDKVGVETKRRTLLKRAVVLRRSQQEEDLERTGTHRVNARLVCMIIEALGQRACLERIRCRQASKRSCVSETTLRSYIDSYWNCVAALVAIGEMTVLTVPDSERFYEIASSTVRAFAFAMIDRPACPRPHDLPFFGDQGYLKPLGFCSLIDPRRYLDPILNATKQKRDRRPVEAGANDTKQALISAMLLERPEDVKDVVRGLFIADVVDVRMAGCGYGDFLLWAGYELDPLDPVLFWDEYELPVMEDEESDEEEGDDEEDDGFELWETDEAGHALSQEELRARYNFTLLSMVRAWEAPWAPESHASFQQGFREAVQTLVACTHHLNMPTEIAKRIAAFFNRTWWPDPRRRCFSYACQAEQCTRLVQTKHDAALGNNNATTLGSSMVAADARPQEEVSIRCSDCGVAWYCSKACQEDDYKACHKTICGLPPFQARSRHPSEQKVYQAVFESVPSALIVGHRDDDDDDDDRDDGQSQAMEADGGESCEGEGDWSDEGSWESEESDDDQATDEGPESSTTRAICRFFESASRKET